MKIRVVSFGKPYVDFEGVESFDLLENHLQIVYSDDTQTFVNRNAYDFFNVIEVTGEVARR